MNSLKSLLRNCSVSFARLKTQAVNNFFDVAVTKANKVQAKITLKIGSQTLKSRIFKINFSKFFVESMPSETLR